MGWPVSWVHPREAAGAFERSAELALSAGEIRFASYALANAADNLLRLGSADAAGACAERALVAPRNDRIDHPLAAAVGKVALIEAQGGKESGVARKAKIVRHIIAPAASTPGSDWMRDRTSR